MIAVLAILTALSAVPCTKTTIMQRRPTDVVTLPQFYDHETRLCARPSVAQPRDLGRS
jgi:hypothetical protein